MLLILIKCFKWETLKIYNIKISVAFNATNYLNCKILRNFANGSDEKGALFFLTRWNTRMTSPRKIITLFFFQDVVESFRTTHMCAFVTVRKTAWADMWQGIWWVMTNILSRNPLRHCRSPTDIIPITLEIESEYLSSYPYLEIESLQFRMSAKHLSTGFKHNGWYVSAY